MRSAPHLLHLLHLLVQAEGGGLPAGEAGGRPAGGDQEGQGAREGGKGGEDTQNNPQCGATGQPQ